MKIPSLRQACLGLLTRLELRRLARVPRFHETATRLFGFPFVVPDAASFLSAYEEIFVRHIYSFRCQKACPRIIDCGANIGLSVLFFKTLFPTAQILAFEADPSIFAVLEKNMQGFGNKGLQLVNGAVWSGRGTTVFNRDGADAGRIGGFPGSAGSVAVETYPLEEHLREEVDFLKMDIEGAELRVLQSCKSLLPHVGALFVEYHSFAGQLQELPELLVLLREAGFRFVIHPSFAPEQPFVDAATHLGMDLQLNIFAIRESREE